MNFFLFAFIALLFLSTSESASKFSPLVRRIFEMGRAEEECMTGVMKWCSGPFNHLLSGVEGRILRVFLQLGA